MGIRLYHSSEVRELCGKHELRTILVTEALLFDFDNTPRIPPHDHYMDVRITAENTEAGFNK